MCYCFPMMSSVKQLRIVALNSLGNVIVRATIKHPIQSGFEPNGVHCVGSTVWSVWQVLSDPCQHQKVILAQCCMYAHTNKRDLPRLCIGTSPFIFFILSWLQNWIQIFCIPQDYLIWQMISQSEMFADRLMHQDQQNDCERVN